MENKLILNPVFNRILYNKKPISQEEFLKLEDGELVSIEIKQVVKNENAGDIDDFLNLNFRLQGHKNAIEIKPTKDLLVWLNFTKQQFAKLNWEEGQEIEGYTLRELYLPITELDSKMGLDKEENITVEPIINPTDNKLLLYSTSICDENGVEIDTQNLPMFRFVVMEKGEYTPVVKPTSRDYINDFSGTKRENGMKTPEYQKWLNNLKPTYNPKPIDLSEVNFEQSQVETVHA